MSKRRYQARVKIISRSNGVEMMDLEVGDFLEKFVGGLDEDNREWYETVVYGATEDEDEESDLPKRFCPFCGSTRWHLSWEAIGLNPDEDRFACADCKATFDRHQTSTPKDPTPSSGRG